MAEHLASIYGTEKDKVNCSFYFKIGACRHGERCSRKHVRPTFSTALLLPNMYHNPAHDPTSSLSPAQLQQHFDLFYDDVFTEMCSYGRLEEMHVCDNVGDHLVGNVYARFESEEEAGRAVEALNGRFYAGRPLFAELSPVTDYKESCCRQYEMNECTRSGFCNFQHFRKPTPALLDELKESQNAFIWEKQETERKAKTVASSGHDRGDKDAPAPSSGDRRRSRSPERRNDASSRSTAPNPPSSHGYDDRRRRREYEGGEDRYAAYDKRRRYDDGGDHEQRRYR